MLLDPNTACPECGGSRVTALFMTHDGRSPELVQPLRAVGVSSLFGGKSSTSSLISNQVVACTRCGLTFTRATHPENLVRDPDKVSDNSAN